MSGGAQDVNGLGRRVHWGKVGAGVSAVTAALGAVFAGVETFREDRVVIQSVAGQPVVDTTAEPTRSARPTSEATAASPSAEDATDPQPQAAAKGPGPEAPADAGEPAKRVDAAQGARTAPVPQQAAPPPAPAPAPTKKPPTSAATPAPQSACTPLPYHYRAYNRSGKGASRVAEAGQMLTQGFAATGDRISDIWVNVGLDDGVTTSGTQMDYRIVISVVSEDGTEIGSAAVTAWKQHGFARFAFRNVTPLACDRTYRLRISNVGDQRLVVYGFPYDEYPRGALSGGDPDSTALDGNLQICRDACEPI